jgi:hypothetical protein
MRVDRLPALAAYGLALLSCAVAATLPKAHEAPPASGAEWPIEWDGRALRPLALGDVEQRFAARFPGSIARLSDGERQIVWREVRQPTRMLHPAADCYRGAGWRVAAERIEVDAEDRGWRCFEAEQAGRRLRVCERITGADETAFTDPSSWFWAALTGRTRGPWQAVTTAQPMPPTQAPTPSFASGRGPG